MLIVFAGLPGTGKTTLARAVAQARAAVYLRIDAIEQALRDCGMSDAAIGAGGYAAGQALAELNLRLGREVVADAVNPVAAAREGWRDVAKASGAALIEIEVICSDPAEHRRRVETRISDIVGLKQPTWREVEARHYEPWDRPHIAVDTAGRPVADSLEEARRLIDRA